MTYSQNFPGVRGEGLEVNGDRGTINGWYVGAHRSSVHNLKTYKLKNLKLTSHRLFHILLAILYIDTLGRNTVLASAHKVVDGVVGANTIAVVLNLLN